MWDISKLSTGNRKSGTGNWFLVPYLGIYYPCSKSANQYKEPVPGSLLTIIRFILVSGFAYIIST